MRTLASILFGLAVVAGCKHEKRKDFGPRFYSKPGDRVICSKGVDAVHEWKHPMLQASLEYAKAHGVVLQTFAHAPTLKLEEYFPDFDWAAAHGLPMVTWAELPTHQGGGWAFNIDDNEVDTWYTWRDALKAHHAHVTFFVSNFAAFTPEQRAKLHELVADGNSVQAHGVAHADALPTVAQRGLDYYVNEEVLPSKTALAAAGFPDPIGFAYPYGNHDASIDAALLQHFTMVRTTGGTRCTLESLK